MSAEHRRPDGSLVQGNYCACCGLPCSMMGHSKCKANPDLVSKVQMANPPEGMEPIYADAVKQVETPHIDETTPFRAPKSAGRDSAPFVPGPGFLFVVRAELTEGSLLTFTSFVPEVYHDEAAAGRRRAALNAARADHCGYFFAMERAHYCG